MHLSTWSKSIRKIDRQLSYIRDTPIRHESACEVGCDGAISFSPVKKWAMSFSNGLAHFFYAPWVCGKGRGDSFFRLVCLNRMSLMALTMTARTLNSWMSMPDVRNTF